MNLQKKETILLPLGQLRPNEGQILGLPRNPRKWSEDALAKLEKSLRDDPEFLQFNPLIVYPYIAETGGAQYVIIGGNMRYSVIKEKQLFDRVPCMVLPEDTPSEKLRAYTIKDNTGFGDWDWELIGEDWSEDPLEDWGLEMGDINLLVDEDSAEAHEDDFDESEVTESVCKLGEVWQLGKHRLMCGDSTSEADVAILMNGEKADLVFTDPPYGVSIGDKNAALNAVNGLHSIERNIENDTLSSTELYDVLVKAMRNVRESSKDDASYYVTSPQGGELCMMMMMMKDAGLAVRHVLIWCKNTATFSLGRLDYDYQHEPIMYTWTKSHHNYRGGENRTSIWHYDKPRKADLHPTMKPIELIANCLKDGTMENDLVIDFFGGSGSTLIASEQLNRKCYMMELDPHYCDVIIARWEKLTGGKAEKIEQKDNTLKSQSRHVEMADSTR